MSTVISPRALAVRSRSDRSAIDLRCAWPRPRSRLLAVLVIGLASLSRDAPASEAKPARPQDPGTIAPTISGVGGLFRTASAQFGAPNTFRIGLHVEAFTGSDFLVEGDENSRFLGTLALSYTAWRYLEIFAKLTSVANNNDRTDPDRLDQEVILALGDFGLGAKMAYPIGGVLSIGASAMVEFLNSVGGLSFDANAIGVYAGLISTLDLSRANPNTPLRLHVNAGYHLDNSNDLSDFTGYPLASLQVEKFALGIRPSRVQVRVGLEAPLSRWIGWGLTPIVELGIDVATADADTDFSRFAPPDGNELTSSDLNGRSSAWLSVGLRLRPVRGLNIDLGSDIGLQSPGYGFGPPVTPWNLILGMSYAFDPEGRTRVVTVERVKRVPRATPTAATFKIKGRVIDGGTGRPIEGAIVAFAGKALTGLSSNADGTFVSYGFPPGPLTILVRHGDYQPLRLNATVRSTPQKTMIVRLARRRPKTGQLSVSVTSAAGRAIAAATVHVDGPTQRRITTGASGQAAAEDLPRGHYTVRATADRYRSAQAEIDVSEGQTARLALSLAKPAPKGLVRLTRRAIITRKKVHFATGTAKLRPDALQILDAVVEVLQDNPKITRLQIAGHTDNRGRATRNLALSQSRAEAVRDYLVSRGISASRLSAMGYGSRQPKVPNLTPFNRARNRRVEFRIITR